MAGKVIAAAAAAAAAELVRQAAGFTPSSYNSRYPPEGGRFISV